MSAVETGDAPSLPVILNLPRPACRQAGTAVFKPQSNSLVIMSDNLAHQLDTLPLGTPAPSSPAVNNFSDSTSPELTLGRLKYQASKQETAVPMETGSKSRTSANQEKTGAGTAQELARIKNMASKASAGDLVGASEEIAGATTQAGTQWLLTVLWGSVWLDWTLLSLLGLNVFLVCSILLPQYVCQFGDDYLIGKWIPSKDLAKWTEIMILMVINIIVLSIIITFVVLIYKIVSCGTWNLFNVWASGALPGGETALSEAEKRCFGIK